MVINFSFDLKHHIIIRVEFLLGSRIIILRRLTEIELHKNCVYFLNEQV